MENEIAVCAKCNLHGVLKDETRLCMTCKDNKSRVNIHDNINHPPHYKSHPSGIECISITEHFDFIIGNIIKYAWRAGLKSGETKLDDLKKCLWYVGRAVEREEVK